MIWGCEKYKTDSSIHMFLWSVIKIVGCNIPLSTLGLIFCIPCPLGIIQKGNRCFIYGVGSWCGRRFCPPGDSVPLTANCVQTSYDSALFWIILLQPMLIFHNGRQNLRETDLPMTPERIISSTSIAANQIYLNLNHPSGWPFTLALAS